ncbi:putative disease resistance protein RGA3 [Phoenix dactylifera]|uniref:Disease resistance protein RGA3 n=1 Tax=Phoenix dactylifera TaxID=42345 RepID=A0A8B8ZV27_PHODC|nr:putative disease resistance protein RGA3 [Phoenix dactylifera]
MDWNNLLSKAASIIPKFPDKLVDWLVSLFQSEYSLIRGLEDEIDKLRRTIPLLSPFHPRLAMDWNNLLSKAASIIPKFPDKLVDWLVSLFQSEYSLIRGLEDEIDKLRRTRDRIHSLVTDAEERRYIEDDSVKRWLRELKEVAFAADELLDRHQTQLNLSPIDQSSGEAGPSRKRKRSWSLHSLGLGHDPVLLQRRRLATQIAKIKERFDEIAEARKNLPLEAGDGRRRGRTGESSPPSQSVASYDSSHVVRREVEKAETVSALMSDHGKVVPVLPIYGAPGIGQTTLAKLVYHDAQVKIFFDLRVWVGLSKGFDVRRVTKEIIEYIGREEKCNISSLDALLRHLSCKVSGKKFLLVLDNLWAENFQFSETLRLPLVAGGKESNVLITAIARLL